MLWIIQLLHRLKVKHILKLKCLLRVIISRLITDFLDKAILN